MNERGPFERGGGGVETSGGDPNRDQSARLILIGMGVIGLILLVLILPPLSILGGGGDGGTPGASSTQGTSSNGSSTTVRLPRVPDGYEALSVLNEDQDDDVRGRTGPFVVSVKLVQVITDSRNIGIYTYQNGQWVRLANGVLQPGGTEVKGELSEIPSNLAVLRRTTTAVQVSGSLAPNAQADERALAAMATVSLLGLAPVADGSVTGAAASAPAGQHANVPVVRASSPAEIEAVNTILANPQLRDAHIAALVQVAISPGNGGVELDYRNVIAARKADLTSFVGLLAQELHKNGRSLTLTLPAPAKAGVSWDTGAYDWEALSNQADMIKMAGEADPSIYYQRMEEVFNYLDPKVDMKKVSLIVSRRSIEKGTDGLVSMSLHDALSLASTIELRTTAQITPGTSVVIVGKNIFQDDGATGIAWDQSAFAVSFAYPGRGGQRTVWIENSLSVAFKLDLARRYGLGGVAFDEISADPAAPDIWGLVTTFGEAGTVDLVAPNSTMLRPAWQVQAGSSDTGQKGNIVWRAPNQPGAYDIALIVSDGVIRAQQKIVLEVRAASGTPATGTSATPSRTGTVPAATSTPRP